MVLLTSINWQAVEYLSVFIRVYQSVLVPNVASNLYDGLHVICNNFIVLVS